MCTVLPFDLFLFFTNKEPFRAGIDDVGLIWIEKDFPTRFTSINHRHEKQVEHFVAEPVCKTRK